MESLASDFRIAVSGWLESPSTSLIEKYCLASLSITAGNQSVCELEDLITKTVRSDIRVSAYDLAVWLISNWWRLRWEPDRKTTDCKMCHHVGAAGGGFAWPSLAFVSDGDFVLVRNEPTDPSPVAPVRYLRDVSLHVPAQAFEAAVDALVETVLGRLADLRSADSELAILVRELRAERSDPDLSGYRRMEALLGFDPDDAPGGMISELQDGMAEWGEAAVEEMVAASRTSAAGLLRELRGDLPAADSIVLPDLPPGPADSLPFRNAGRQLPWQTARDAARRLRVQWGILAGPIGTTQLADLLRVNKGMIDSGPAHASSLAAGYRDSAGGGRISILLKSKFETGRRFEIARVVGDTLVAPGRDHLLPVTNAKTSRHYLDSLHRSFNDLGGLVQVVHGRDPRATRSAPTSDGAARVGGTCGPTWASPGMGVRGKGANWLWITRSLRHRLSFQSRNAEQQMVGTTTSRSSCATASPMMPISTVSSSTCR